MPGSGQPFTTLGDGKDHTVAQLVAIFDPTPSFAITVRADPNNASQFKLGRLSAFEPFYKNDSRTFYSCRPEELVLNDLGTVGLIIYFDFSGPMDPKAQYATVVPGAAWAGRKAPNDPTP